ncbi:YajG family lipoprotein [Alkalilimnicola ehrlichii MLHE-1]|uniref:Lipoprotein n=1 Tax=Alkalilimnicola ehrlichii (strain ATCC BAA-1101 / DSM 17681 / MLHE-1) TaxID=187272 RepID=Q0A8M1_ALKEH|nr:YajG family lipoprotein [Alkalilimnicola ehrlichii]ABI56816.1 hypothetical protein Mlg_1467 [Alkalilimnicola ehrlichii MLHE-1]
MAPRAVIAVLMLALLVAGCAPGSQTVRLEPRPDVARSDEGQGITVALTVEDRRDDPVIGFRDGERGGEARIEPYEDPALGIRRGVTRALERRGFEVVAAGVPADRRLHIALEALQYERQAGVVTRGIHLEGRMSARVERGDGDRYTGKARARSERRLVHSPSQTENEQMINEVVTRMLERLLDEAPLREMLAGDRR